MAIKAAMQGANQLVGSTGGLGVSLKDTSTQSEDRGLNQQPSICQTAALPPVAKVSSMMVTVPPPQPTIWLHSKQIFCFYFCWSVKRIAFAVAFISPSPFKKGKEGELWQQWQCLCEAGLVAAHLPHAAVCRNQHFSARTLSLAWRGGTSQRTTVNVSGAKQEEQS